MGLLPIYASNLERYIDASLSESKKVVWVMHGGKTLSNKACL